MSAHLDSLERLAGLFERGILTKEEFEAEKLRLLDLFREEHTSTETELPGSRSTRTINNKTLFIVVGISFASLALLLIVWSNPVSTKPVIRSPKQAVPTKNYPNPHENIAFSDPSKCKPAAEFGALLDRIRQAKPGSQFENAIVKGEGISNAQVESVGTPGSTGATLIAQIPTSLQWHGLTIVSLKTTDWDKGSGFQVLFKERSAIAHAVLNRSGFNLSGKENVAKDGIFIGIEDIDEGSALTCQHATQAVDQQALGLGYDHN